uniref:COesterase domain-containing protein n=1 Tax=Meloidogyne hapla TaxID=6305 RepID=A0A1I8B402_MELHA
MAHMFADESIQNVVECLKRVPTAIIQRAGDAVSLSLSLPMDFAFVPIDEDTHFFRGNLFEKLRRKDFKRDVSILVANPWPQWMGAMHGYEIGIYLILCHLMFKLEYVFGLPLRSPHLYDPSELELEVSFSTEIMEFWGNFARTGEPVEFWPKYNRITRKSLVLSEEIARGTSHRIYVDVHGKLCRLLEEAQAVAGISGEQMRICSGDHSITSGELAHMKKDDNEVERNAGISDTFRIPSTKIFISLLIILILAPLRSPVI